MRQDKTRQKRYIKTGQTKLNKSSMQQKTKPVRQDMYYYPSKQTKQDKTTEIYEGSKTLKKDRH